MNLLPAFVGKPEVNRVYNCDALTLLKALPDNSVDLVFIDPPYGNNNGVGDLAAARARDKVRGGRQSGEILAIANDSADDWKTLMPPILIEINRVLKPVGACCCCTMGGGAEGVLFAKLASWLDQYHEFFQAVVWNKSKRGDGMGWRYRRNYEFVMVSHKRGGKLAWNNNRPAQPNVINFAPTKNEYHPTEKPLELVKFFILNHTQPCAVVLDCFAGSGTTGLACLELKRDYILADIEAKHCATATFRTSQYTPSFLPALESASA